MRNILIAVFLLFSVYAIAQQGAANNTVFYSSVDGSPADTTSSAFTDALAANVAKGYAYIFWNAQAVTDHWDVYTASGVQHIFTFGSGGGGGGSAINNVLDINTTQAGNVTTGEDELYSFTVDKDSIDDDNDVLHARFSGTLAGNGNTKTIKVYFGNDPIVNVSGTFTSTWTINCEIIRVSETLQHSNCATVGASSGLTHSSVVNDLNQDLTSDVEISLTGESTEGTTNDIVFETATIFRNTGGGGLGGGGGDLSLADLVFNETPSGSVNGSNVTFTTANAASVIIGVYLDGLLQDEGVSDDYTYSGSTLTMNEAPLTGSKVRISYIK